MTTLTKSTAALLCAALTLPLATPAAADESATDFVVQSEVAMTKWQKETTADLNRYLMGAPHQLGTKLKSSIVQVSFTVDERGKADNVEVVGGNGNLAAKRAARYAVRRLGNLDEVPVQQPQNAKFLANIIFADDLVQHKRLIAELERDNNPRFALVRPDETTVLLGG